MVEQKEIFEVLRDDDNSRRLERLRAMCENDAAALTSVLLTALESAETKMRARAAQALGVLPIKESPAVADAIMNHLKTDADSKVRLCCAIKLMRNETPQVDAAFLHAAHDENDKVAQVACGQLGFRGGKDAANALFETLSSPSWRVRLAACKALILLEAADQRVIATLEAMSQEPEATVHDEEVDYFDEHFRQLYDEMPDEPKNRMWRRMATILEQAREVAARQNYSARAGNVKTLR